MLCISIGKNSGTTIKGPTVSSMNKRAAAPSMAMAMTAAERSSTKETMRPQFVLFGDSLTQQSFGPGGFGAALADLYSRKADVILRGYGGYNTRWALFLLDKVFPKSSEPHLVTVFFGANDSALPDRGSKRQHVPLSEFKTNLLHIVSHIQGNCEKTVVVLITPPPIDEDGRRTFARATYGNNAHEDPERTNEAAGQYAAACKEVGKEAGIPVLDLWSVFQQTPEWQQAFLNDGLHLTPAGNRVVLDEFLKVLESMPSLKANTMPFDFPEHSEVQADNPSVTFQPKALKDTCMLPFLSLFASLLLKTPFLCGLLIEVLHLLV